MQALPSAAGGGGQGEQRVRALRGWFICRPKQRPLRRSYMVCVELVCRLWSGNYLDEVDVYRVVERWPGVTQPLNDAAVMHRH